MTTKQRSRTGSRGGSSRSSSRGRSNYGHSNRGGRSGGRSGSRRKQPTFDPSQFINRHPVKAVAEEEYVSKNSFDSFGFTGTLRQNLTRMGYKQPSPIQDQVIPEILRERDVIGLAETGTGKTAAFLLPIIEHVARRKDNHQQVLILAPTRELAIQINDELYKLCRGMGIFSTICVGGVAIGPQAKSLRRLNQFIIGTPGRIIDLMERKCIDPSRLTTVVLDEADRMLDMGFVHDMRRILSDTPKERHTLLFSATTSKEADKIIHDFLRDPVTVSVKKQDITSQIVQDVVPYEYGKRFDTLMEMLSKAEFSRVLVFGMMKHSVKRLAQDLEKAGVAADCIHGNKTHSQRQRALKAFKSGKARVLVATDVAARGIHVDDVSHVINYDLPETFQDYVHRIGRTGRGDKRGIALTFIEKK